MAACRSAGTAIVFAPHPSRMVVGCVFTCGCFCEIEAPVCFDAQCHVDAWFEARRETLADTARAG